MHEEKLKNEHDQENAQNDEEDERMQAASEVKSSYARKAKALSAELKNSDALLIDRDLAKLKLDRKKQGLPVADDVKSIAGSEKMQQLFLFLFVSTLVLAMVISSRISRYQYFWSRPRPEKQKHLSPSQNPPKSEYKPITVEQADQNVKEHRSK